MMREGLLWYDDDPARSLTEKVGRAVQRYRQKLGRDPDACYVHPAALQGDGEREVDGVRVAPLPSVLPHHFWVGREGERNRPGLVARAAAAQRAMTPERARQLVESAEHATS